MSRIGLKPIPIPEGVNITVSDNKVAVKGPKGELVQFIPEGMEITIEEKVLTIKRLSDEKKYKALHGLTRSLLANMVEGVTWGFKKELELVGVGYRAAKQGKNLVLNVGYSQPVTIVPEEGIEIEVPTTNRVTVAGIDKQLVGNTAAIIRRVRPPEPYKGKGIKYLNEHIRRKVGKTGK
ncbi:MAG TPA: 50S ribosomal protein L6 [Firmicutes bacterium]|nr:50S ribosomal protein L6 [Bacillota bacterium]